MADKKYIKLASYKFSSISKKMQKALSPYNIGAWEIEFCVMGDLILEQTDFDFHNVDDCIEFLQEWNKSHVESRITSVPIQYDDGYQSVVQGFVPMADEVRDAVLSLIAKEKAEELERKESQLEHARKLLRETGEL